MQVVLELVSRAPARASHLVLMSGTYRRPFSSVRLRRRALARRYGGRKETRGSSARVVERLARSRGAADWVRRLRIVNPRLETEDLLALAEEFRAIDFDVYLRTLRALNDHDGTRSLAHVAAPCSSSPARETFCFRRAPPATS